MLSSCQPRQNWEEWQNKCALHLDLCPFSRKGEAGLNLFSFFDETIGMRSFYSQYFRCHPQRRVISCWERMQNASKELDGGNESSKNKLKNDQVQLWPNWEKLQKGQKSQGWKSPLPTPVFSFKASLNSESKGQRDLTVHPVQRRRSLSFKHCSTKCF